MKKVLLPSLLLLVLSKELIAQLPVSTLPMNKNVVLEQFVGIQCGYSPDGDRMAKALRDSNPTKVFLVDIHAWSFANASPGQPDLTNTIGNSICYMPGMGISYVPSGSINRTLFQNSNFALAGSRNSWANWADTILAQPAYCNVAIQGSLDVQTRVLTAQVEIYYTANSPVSTNSLQVFLLEDSIGGFQKNWGNPIYFPTNYNSNGLYKHNNVLRAALTPTFGSSIVNTTMGSLVTMTYTYTVPLTYGAIGKTTTPDLLNLKLMAFVTQSDRNTINAHDGPIYLKNFGHSLDVGIMNYKAGDPTCVGNIKPSFQFFNYGADTITSATFSYHINNSAALAYSVGSLQVPPLKLSPVISLPSMLFTPSYADSLKLVITKINGQPDEKTSDNMASQKISTNHLELIHLNAKIDFVQDMYGTESSWYLINESSLDTISKDGPWSNLSSATPTLSHVKTFTLDPISCYKLTVNDSKGDGVNSNFGNGGYTFYANNSLQFTSNGMYGKKEVKVFNTYDPNPLGINQERIDSQKLTIQPNPSFGDTKVYYDLHGSTLQELSVYDEEGKKVVDLNLIKYPSTDTYVSLNTVEWPNGMYYVSLQTLSGRMTGKLLVSH